jgi:hypothetical protein
MSHRGRFSFDGQAANVGYPRAPQHCADVAREIVKIFGRFADEEGAVVAVQACTEALENGIANGDAV